MTTEFRYAPRVVMAGYARSAFGLTITVGPLLFLHPASWMAVVLAGGAALFLIYAAGVAVRHSRSFSLGETGIEARGLFGSKIRWDELGAVQLNYYSTHSDRRHGWVELIVRGARDVIRIESSIDGFPAIAGRVAMEATRHGCPLDEDSRVHLAQLGVHVDAQPAAQSRSERGIRHA
jgi:hypothetical protein